jgi:hypothetical protein
MSNFKKALQKRREEAAAQPPGPKDPSQMSEEELDRETERLEKEIRGSKEQLVRAAREERSAVTQPRRVLLPNKRRRRYWK